MNHFVYEQLDDPETVCKDCVQLRSPVAKHRLKGSTKVQLDVTWQWREARMYVRVSVRV